MQRLKLPIGSKIILGIFDNKLSPVTGDAGSWVIHSSLARSEEPKLLSHGLLSLINLSMNSAGFFILFPYSEGEADKIPHITLKFPIQE